MVGYPGQILALGFNRSENLKVEHEVWITVYNSLSEVLRWLRHFRRSIARS